MLKRLQLQCSADRRELTREAERLLRTFPDLPVTAAGDEPADVVISQARWQHDQFDPVTLDHEVAAHAGELTLRLAAPHASAVACVNTALQVVTRYQRLLGGRNRFSAAPLFDRVLALHRRLHDLDKPLVAADFDHALDTWRWVLRLERDASAAVQIAALFHDVERLVSESEVRVEQHAADYRAFKDAHAAKGAEMASTLLAQAGADQALRDRVFALVCRHEQLASDAELLLLGEADALSFFSLNACGFINYYGRAHTRRKVAYTLGRLGDRGRRELRGVRHRADIAQLIDEVLGPDAAAFHRLPSPAASEVAR